MIPLLRAPVSGRTTSALKDAANGIKRGALCSAFRSPHVSTLSTCPSLSNLSRAALSSTRGEVDYLALILTYQQALVGKALVGAVMRNALQLSPSLCHAGGGGGAHR